MLDFELQRCTRNCAKTNRELQPGEPIYSVLVTEGSQTRRLDYSADAWSEPPAETIAWWKSTIPGGATKRAQWAPHDVILDYFDRLATDPTKADVRYVLALFMIRRRMLRLEETQRTENGNELLVLSCPKRETEVQVEVVMPTPARATEIQAELADLLVTPAG